MDISGVSANGAVNAVLAQKEVHQEGDVKVALFKKALDTQTENAMALIDSLPQAAPTRQGLPPNLGNNINTTA